MNYELLDKIPVADKYSNKSNNGILSVIAGSEFISGSAVFNLLAASAVGTGYIYGVVTNDIFPICSSFAPWVVYKKTYSPLKENTILIGSGCDNRDDFDQILKDTVTSDRRLVIDAYALRRYSDLKLKRKGITIMTPHLGEFSYMSGYSVSEIKDNKEQISIEYSKKHNCILVLKDYETLITDGENIYINTSGNASLAKAGSGDILAGFIAGLVSRNVDPFEACKISSYLLGLSAEKASEHIAISSISPIDIIDEAKRILFEAKK